MKKTVLTMALALFFFLSYSQEKRKSFMWDEADLKEIGVSEKQIERLLLITKESQKKVGEIKRNESSSEDEKKEATLEEYRKRKAERIKVVTPEQLKKANKINKERRAAADK